MTVFFAGWIKIGDIIEMLEFMYLIYRHIDYKGIMQI